MYRNSLIFYIIVSNVISFVICFGLTYYFKKKYYDAKTNNKQQWKCQPEKQSSKKIIIRDIKLGIFNLVLLSTLSGIFIYYIVISGYSAIYFNLSIHSLEFSILTALLYLLLIDCILYWAHRLFHQPFLFKKIHRIHHRTTTPIAINAFAMHPIEGLTYHFLTLLPLMFLPLHFIGAIFVMLYTYYVSLIDHSGIKFNAPIYGQSPSQFHDDHHQFFHVNFGQTFWFWDYLFGSFRKKDKTYTIDSFEDKQNFKLYLEHSNYVEYESREHFLIRNRSIIIILFCLPVSFIFSCISNQNRKLKRYFNSKRNHVSSCIQIQKECQLWNERPKEFRKTLTTNRKNWMSLSTRFYDKNKCHSIYTSHLTNILSIDFEKGIVRTEPMVTVGQMIDYLIPYHYTLANALEIREATLGGLAMGVGMTTHSHKVGLYQETIVAYEVVLPTGELLRVTENEHTDLFYALPWSHGTLGIVVALELKIIPIKKFVRILYTPFYSKDEYCNKIRELAIQENVADFLECTIFSKNEAVIIQGWFDDGLNSKLPINYINTFYRPWFFKQVESVLNKGEKTELIPYKDYVFRHNRSIFWTLQDMLPNGNHWLMRALLGWMYPPNIAFLKLSTSKAVRKLAYSKQVYQDIILPMTVLSEAIDLSDKLFSIYPLLVYPCRIYDHGTEKGQIRAPRHLDRVYHKDYGMYCDLGIYGIPKLVKEKIEYDMVSNMRQMETFIIQNNGYSFLYADTFMTRHEFSRMFDLNLYETVRERYNLSGAFPHVYEKTRSEKEVLIESNV